MPLVSTTQWSQSKAENYKKNQHIFFKVKKLLFQDNTKASAIFTGVKAYVPCSYLLCFALVDSIVTKRMKHGVEFLNKNLPGNMEFFSISGKLQEWLLITKLNMIQT